MAHIKKYSNLRVVREMQMKLHLDTFSPFRLSKIKSGMNVNWYNLYARQFDNIYYIANANTL